MDHHQASAGIKPFVALGLDPAIAAIVIKHRRQDRKLARVRDPTERHVVSHLHWKRIMIRFFDWLKTGAGALLGALVAYQVGHWREQSAGYDKHVAETAAANLKAELERKGDDAALRGMSDYDLCVVGLRAQRMPVDACDQLRGIRGE